MHILFLDILYVAFERNYNGNQHFVLSGSCINNILYFFHSFVKNTAWDAHLQNILMKPKLILLWIWVKTRYHKRRFFHEGKGILTKPRQLCEILCAPAGRFRKDASHSVGVTWMPAVNCKKRTYIKTLDMSKY